jgi:hypothetical protein
MPFQRATVTAAPHIILHYRLAFPRIALFSAINFLLALLAVVLWVLVGVPSRAAGAADRVLPLATAPIQLNLDAANASANNTMLDPGAGAGAAPNNFTVAGSDAFEAASYGEWRVDAQLRVLTGLALGACVFVGGMVVEGLWILGGWVLL